MITKYCRNKILEQNEFPTGIFKLIFTFPEYKIVSVKKIATTKAQFHGSAYRRILRLRSRFPAYVQAPNFCASLVSVECLVM